MKLSVYFMWLSITAASAMTFAQAPTKPADTQIASETLASSVTLPASAQGALVMAPCHECVPKSFRATATTTYFIGERQVTLAELKADTTRRPQSILTVSYMPLSGILLKVSAEPAPRSQPKAR